MLQYCLLYFLCCIVWLFFVLFLKIVSRMLEDMPFYIRYPANIYMLRFKETLFIERKVKEILFEGYPQPMLDEIQSLTGKHIVTDGKFGLYAGVRSFKKFTNLHRH